MDCEGRLDKDNLAESIQQVIESHNIFETLVLMSGRRETVKEWKALEESLSQVHQGRNLSLLKQG